MICFQLHKIQVLCCVAGLFVASTCQAQLSSRDPSEWSGFGTPAVEPDRQGPLADHLFLALKESGPWQVQAAGELGQAEAQLLDLIRQAHWTEALTWLKKERPDPNARDAFGATPLSLAAAGGDPALVTELLRRGAAPDRIGAGGMTPLGIAALRGHELVVRELLRKGARPEVANAIGQSPLHLASASGQVRIVGMLLSAGADPRTFNREGRHALAEAAYFGQLGVMQQLVEARMPLDLPDRYGRNALHAAALGHQKDAVDWLVQRGVASTSVLTDVLLSQTD